MRFVTDKDGVIQDAEPLQGHIWKGALIPVKQQQLGELCMLHKPPQIEYGYLNYKVIKMEVITGEKQ